MPTQNASAVLALFPGALGDFICLWPTLHALARSHGRVTVVTHPSFFELLDSTRFRGLSIDRREVADLHSRSELAATTRELFAGHPRVLSWSSADDARFAERLGQACGGAVEMFAFRGMSLGEHAAEYYARCAGCTLRPERLRIPRETRQWAEKFHRLHRTNGRALVVHPGSGGASKNWEGMAELAAWWRAERGTVAALIGPVEDERRTVIPHDFAIREESLLRVAALLNGAFAYVGNDSGISHLAGIAGARGLALFGSTDPAVWHPLGDGLTVLMAANDCAACAGRFCVHRLPVERVRAALDSAFVEHC